MSSTPNSRRWIVIAVIGFALGLIGWGLSVWLDEQLIFAEQLVEDGEWSQARSILKRYLTIKASDDSARMLLARALISDNSLPIDQVAREALGQLERIPQDSGQSASARIAEGRIYLLLLFQPGRAERSLRRAVELAPDRTEAHALLWRLYDLTGRWFLVDTHFWKIYEKSMATDRAVVLRDWYMTEFSPASAVADLERQMGILKSDEQPDLQTEVHRFDAFIANEPEWPISYACLARWYQNLGSRNKALEYVRQAEEVPGGMEDPFVIATRITVSLELGEFAEAEAAFKRWPTTDTGYEYWKSGGAVEDQIQHRDEAARQSYEKALSFDVGQSDWQTLHRLSNVMMRLGDKDRATSLRQLSKSIEVEMEPQVHRPLRTALLHPTDPQTTAMMAEFYEKIGRPRESRAWKELGASTGNSAGENK